MITQSKIEFDGILSDLSLFNASVDTGSQTAFMHAFIYAIIIHS